MVGNHFKDRADEANVRFNYFMKGLEQQVKGKRYFFGEELTLADNALFRQLKNINSFEIPN